jgi:hypothetical protein
MAAKRENFLEKTTIIADDTGHTFKPNKNGVHAEVFEISFANVNSETTVFLAFLDEDGGQVFEQALGATGTVASGAIFDETFETSHQQCMIQLDNGALADSSGNRIVLHCIAGPRNGGVNGISHLEVEPSEG